MKIASVFALIQGDQWQGLYCNNHLIWQGIKLEIGEFARLCDVYLVEINANMDDLQNFPPTLHGLL
jgi:hypothetical protein